MKSILKSRFKNIEEKHISNFEIARTGTSKTKPSTREKAKEEPLSLF